MDRIPTEFILVILATAGGIARYLSNYTKGIPFNLWTFIASTFVSGFSGYMFALVGVSMNFPLPILFMFAGCGGFFGDQSLKLVMEYITDKIK